MDSCRTCRFASIMKQQCRAEPPQVFPVITERGPLPFTCFPGLPQDYSACGAYREADALEIERREAEHPVTVREVA